MNDVITKNTDIRSNILTLEDRINAAKREHNIPDVDCPLTHVFAPGAYLRQIFIPKDTLVVGKIHKHAHLNILVKGRVLVATEEGPVHYEAPRAMTSKAGTKRVVYTYEDTVWATVHVTDKTDLVEIEDEIIAKDYAAFDALQDPEVRDVLNIVKQEALS